MLKKQNRLAKISQKNKGRVFTSHLFNIRVTEGKSKESKFGFVVSKKVNKSAVLRNRTKRVLKKIIKDNLEKIVQGKEVVIVSKKDLNWEDIKETEEALISILEKAKILK